MPFARTESVQRAFDPAEYLEFGSSQPTETEISLISIISSPLGDLAKTSGMVKDRHLPACLGI